MIRRESVPEKALRYVGEGRLRVGLVNGRVVRASCRGSAAEPYSVGFDPEAYCTCPARGRCAHQVALALVVSPPDTSDGAHAGSGKEVAGNGGF